MRAQRVRQLKNLLIEKLGVSPIQFLFRRFKKDFLLGNLESWQAPKPQLENHQAKIVKQESISSSFKIRKETLISKMLKKIRRIFYRLMNKLFKIGKCIHCNKWTQDKGRFTDDPDDTYGYLDWCCEGCYEYLEERL